MVLAIGRAQRVPSHLGKGTSLLSSAVLLARADSTAGHGAGGHGAGGHGAGGTCTLLGVLQRVPEGSSGWVAEARPGRARAVLGEELSPRSAAGRQPSLPRQYRRFAASRWI